MRRLALLLIVLVAGKSFATGEINVLTDLHSPFPPGCVGPWLPQQPFDADNTLYDITIDVPSVHSPTRDAQIQVTIWRTGCHDQGFSVIMVRLAHVDGNDVLVPQVFADAGEVNLPLHQAQLIRHPAVGNVGATGNFISPDGITYMLAVDPLAVDGQTDFTPTDYNDVVTLELFWDEFAPLDQPGGELFFLDQYVAQLDPPQFEDPILHGRMSGQYVIVGIPRSGLVLHIAEQADDTNFAMALFFTYRDGQPFWVTGNTGGVEPGFDSVKFDMVYLEGGEFFGLGPDLFDGDDIHTEVIGEMTIEALDCNTLVLKYDFEKAGLGGGAVAAERLVRVAGYDCNPWR